MALFGFLRRKEKPLRQQLLEAQANVERQLQVASAAPSYQLQPDMGSAIDALNAELAEINDALANLKDDDA